MAHWLLAAEVRNAIEQARASGLTPPLQAQVEYEARFGAGGPDGSRILGVAGDVAEVRVAGVITKAPDLLAMLFGGGNTTWPEIVAALASADADPDIKRIELRIDSPGGSVDGMFDAIAALQAVKKPTRAVVHNVAASAAYGFASQADEVVAANRAARIGSVGIIAGYQIDPTVVKVTSTAAPNKNPDVTTEEGRAVVREELDALHALFVESIAAGRKTTPEKVNAEYGQGATLLADEALKRGMIDAVAGTKPLQLVKPATTTRAATAEQENIMDLSTLKAQYPAVYAEAVGEGVAKERDRVSAHLVMGEASGDMKTAIGAVKDGSEMTATLQASYMAAGMNRADNGNRAADEAAAAAALGGARERENQSAEGETAVLALVESALGITGGAAK